jgi:hypothetical protein
MPSQLRSVIEGPQCRAFAALMLTGAALGDRFGRRRMYVAESAPLRAMSLPGQSGLYW